MSDIGLSALLLFDTEDNRFALGFELGRVWAILRASTDEFEAVMHAESAEMILRLAEATDREVRTEELGDGWVNAYFSETA